MHQILVSYCLHTVFLAPFWRPLRRRIASYLDSDLGVSKTVLHDASGNVTDNGKVTLVYDATEQPVSMGGATAGTFFYDGHYRRAKQVIDGETVYSFYDLSGALLHRDNVTTGVNTDYIRLAGELIARRTNQSGDWSYLHPLIGAPTPINHLGSAVAATDPNGALLWREHYTAYGEKMLEPAANDNHDGFTGHVSDEASGLTYMQARYYDPVIARFLSADPVGFVESGFNPQMFNRYSYALNDPVNLTDPDGRCPLCALAHPGVRGAIGFAGGALAGGVINSVAQIAKNGGFNDFSVGQAVGAAAASGTVAAAVAVNPALATQPGALAGVGATTAAAGSAAGDAIDGKPINSGKALSAAAGGALGAPSGALFKGVVGDVAGAAIGEATAVTATTTVEGAVQLGQDVVDGVQGFAGDLFELNESTKESLNPSSEPEEPF